MSNFLNELLAPPTAVAEAWYMVAREQIRSQSRGSITPKIDQHPNAEAFDFCRMTQIAERYLNLPSEILKPASSPWPTTTTSAPYSSSAAATSR